MIGTVHFTGSAADNAHMTLKILKFLATASAIAVLATAAALPASATANPAPAKATHVRVTQTCANGRVKVHMTWDAANRAKAPTENFLAGIDKAHALIPYSPHAAFDATVRIADYHYLNIVSIGESAYAVKNVKVRGVHCS